MSQLSAVAERLADPPYRETVTVHGRSMEPLIHDGQTVEIRRFPPGLLEIGDVVLATVKGHVYLHKITAINKSRKRVQIGNNHGGINGWTSYAKIHGCAVMIRRPPR